MIVLTTSHVMLGVWIAAKTTHTLLTEKVPLEIFFVALMLMEKLVIHLTAKILSNVKRTVSLTARKEPPLIVVLEERKITSIATVNLTLIALLILIVMESLIAVKQKTTLIVTRTSIATLQILTATQNLTVNPATTALVHHLHHHRLRLHLRGNAGAWHNRPSTGGNSHARCLVIA